MRTRALQPARIVRRRTTEENVVDYKPQIDRICETVVIKVASGGGTASILRVRAAKKDRVDLLPEVNGVNKRVRIKVALERTLAITCIANVVPVGVCLAWIVSGGTIVASIANTIGIGVSQTRVG